MAGWVHNRRRSRIRRGRRRAGEPSNKPPGRADRHHRFDLHPDAALVSGLGEPISGNVPNPNPVGEEVGSVGRSAKRILIKRILIEALVLAVPFVWRRVREYRRGK